MQKKIWLFVFFTALLVNLSSIVVPSAIFFFFSKPLLVLSLIGWLFFSLKQYGGAVYLFPLAALFFSLLGDILLLFEKANPLFFIVGLISFLIAHVGYIIIFNRIRTKNNISIKWWIIFIILCYYSILLSSLFPNLGQMKIPVVVYGAVISTMFFVALHLLYNKSNANMQIVMGAILFVVSDSILAFNKFYNNFSSASFLIMLTYAFAQYFIIKGIISNTTNGKFVIGKL